jgi:hypothetical protein
MSDDLKLTVRIERDDHPENPRREQTNLGEFFMRHGRYDFGDPDTECPDDPSEFEAWAKEEGAVYLPVFMYSHSGVTINTTGFSCPWDSGQIGVIYATPAHMRECYMVTELTDEHREMAERDLVGQIKQLDQWLRGDVWGYVIEDEDDEHVDSCWGFYGIEYAKEEAAAALAAALETA